MPWCSLCSRTWVDLFSIFISPVFFVQRLLSPFSPTLRDFWTSTAESCLLLLLRLADPSEMRLPQDLVCCVLGKRALSCYVVFSPLVSSALCLGQLCTWIVHNELKHFACVNVGSCKNGWQICSCITREFEMCEIEHFVNPSDKTHPKFVNVKEHKLLLFPRSLQLSTGNVLCCTIGEAVEKVPFLLSISWHTKASNNSKYFLQFCMPFLGSDCQRNSWLFHCPYIHVFDKQWC